MAGHQKEQFAAFAAVMPGLGSLSKPDGDSAAAILLDMAAMTRRFGLPSLSSNNESGECLVPVASQLLGAIAVALLEVPGSSGRHGLQTLLDQESRADVRWHLRRILAQHAEREAASKGVWSVEQLRSLHSVFDVAPTTEVLLFEQVVARLEEIQISMEQGKFSERGLFYPDMREELVQLWLANRLDGTRGRRFTVHREEEVDLRTRPDIQCSCAPAVVCIEIKPVGRHYRYSANSLTETLKVQLVGQYLRGTNSSSGILVLFQLDDKRWELPHGRDCSFDELVSYLQQAAVCIKRDMPEVKELRVIGIRCIA